MCYKTKEKFSYIIHYTVNHVLSESLLIITMSTIYRGITCCQSPRNGFITVADSGEGPGGPLPPLLFLDQTEARRAEKFFLATGPTPLPQGLDPALHYCCRNNLYKVVTSFLKKLYTLFISGRNHLFRPRSHRVIFLFFIVH